MPSYVRLLIILLFQAMFIQFFVEIQRDYKKSCKIMAKSKSFQAMETGKFLRNLHKFTGLS